MIFPSADTVAQAVVTASRLCRVEPEETVGARRTLVPVAAARARSYAAMALNHVFNVERPGRKHGQYPLSRVAIARMVGVPKPSQDGFVHALETKLLKRKKMGWWDTRVFDQVVVAVRWTMNTSLEIPAEAEKPAAHASAPVRRDMVTSVARRRDPEPPQAREEIKAPAKAVPAVAAKVVNRPVPGGVRFERNGVSMDPLAWRITWKGSSVEIRDADAYLVVQHLARVMPALLPTETLGERIWGTTRDAGYRVGAAVDRANALLKDIKLKIGSMPKFGFALSEV